MRRIQDLTRSQNVLCTYSSKAAMIFTTGPSAAEPIPRPNPKFKSTPCNLVSRTTSARLRLVSGISAPLSAERTGRSTRRPRAFEEPLAE